MRLIKYIMSIAEFALSKIGLGVDRREEKLAKLGEFARFEQFGDFGVVELAPSGGVYLDINQLRMFRQRDGMKGCSVERQEDGRYLVNVRKVI